MPAGTAGRGGAFEQVHRTDTGVVQISADSLGKSAIDSLTEVARRGFGTNMDREEVAEHLHAAEILHVFKSQGGKLAGFASYSTMQARVSNPHCGDGAGEKFGIDATVLYLNGIVLDSGLQGKGNFALSAKAVMTLINPHAFALRTQNPAMYSALRKIGLSMGFAHRMFPSLDASSNRYAAVIAMEIASMLNERNFNPESFVEAGTYGRALNGHVPRVNEEVERLFVKLGINRETGDSMIIVAMLRDLERQIV
jgi:hypothetical protein